MSNLKELLQGADPLRHEPETWAHQKPLRRPAVLAAASEIHPRVGRLVASRIAIVLAAMVVLLAVFFVGARVWRPLRTVQAAVRFEVRFAEEMPAPGLREAKVEGSDRSVYLHNEVIVSNGDISAAKIVETGPDQYNISVEFNAVGAQKMREATAAHIGKLMAILLDGKVVMAPTLHSLISGSARISGKFTKAEAERLATGIKLTE